jgi:hypothetical protein
MNTDKSGEGRILSLSTLGEPMSEEEFEDKMNTYELEDRYAEFIENNHPVGNNHVLIRLMESGDFYDDFKEYIMSGGK